MMWISFGMIASILLIATLLLVSPAALIVTLCPLCLLPCCGSLFLLPMTGVIAARLTQREIEAETYELVLLTTATDRDMVDNFYQAVLIRLHSMRVALLVVLIVTTLGFILFVAVLENTTSDLEPNLNPDPDPSWSRMLVLIPVAIGVWGLMPMTVACGVLFSLWWRIGELAIMASLVVAVVPLFLIALVWFPLFADDFGSLAVWTSAIIIAALPYVIKWVVLRLAERFVRVG